MAIAVIARLDDVGEVQIERLADSLPDRRSGRPPLHLRLATYGDETDIKAVDDALSRAIQHWTQISVSLVGFGIFPGDPSDVWLLPVPIHRLLELHRDVDAALLKAANRRSYEFGIWTPTVSIGETEHDSDSIEVLARLYDGPIDVTLNRIEIVRTKPFEIISSWVLPG